MVEVFPNPSSNFFNLIFSENIELEKVQLFNSIGQLISVLNSKEIDMSSFEKGMYFIIIYTNKGMITKKITTI